MIPVLITASHWDESLLRAVAVLQVQFQLLNQQAEQFTELADMQAHRRIKSDLTEYIVAHARAGTVPADPLAELVSRLGKLVSFFPESATLHRVSVSLHQRFFQGDLSAVSLSDVRQGQVELNEATANFPASLNHLAIQLSALDWDGNGADSDIHPELLFCAQGLGMDLSVEARARRELRSLALREGELYQQVQTRFKNVRSRLEHLTQIHAKHRDALQLAFAQGVQGNHLSAANLLAAADLKQRSVDGFCDLDYTTVTANIASLTQSEDEAVSFAKDLPLACAKILDEFKIHYDIVSRHGQAKLQLAVLRRAFEQHWVKVTALPGSELEKNCRPSLETVQPDLAKTETALVTMAATGARSRRRSLIAVAITGMLVLIALAHGISTSRKRAENETRAVAEAKATAERVAAAEAQAAAERLIADTKMATERVAAEAERVATEAKATIERAAVETAELQQRITEAEANLAKIKLEFQKPEAEFREARKAKEKLLSDIADQIFATQRELDAAEHDSAEQYYGPMLIRLLGSFRGSETFSGNEKHPKTTDAIRILDHTLKSQVSKSSTGYEDISNVKGFYFVSDFAFMNIPERDRYSWSERSKIDKLIGEYLTDGAAYNASRQTSIGLLHATLQSRKALEVKARADLKSIAVAESEARKPMKRAQELVDALRSRSTLNK